MNEIVNMIICITAIALIGCVCGFLVLLNMVKKEIERNPACDKTKDKDI